MQKIMNVYRFSTKGKEPKIVVAKNITDASANVNFDWENCKCVYKDVTIVE